MRSKLFKRVFRKPYRVFLSAIPRRPEILKMAIDYIDMYMNDNDYNFYNNGEVYVIRSVLSSTGVCVVFDVGANQGDWTEEVLKHNPQAQVHCFEPGIYAFAQLQARNFPTNVILNPVGIGERRESRELILNKVNSQLSSIYPKVAGTNVETMTINLDTIDQYCADHHIDRIDLLKIDVEGHEIPVLYGAKSMFSEQRIGCAIFEYAQHWIQSRRFLLDAFEFAHAVNYDVYKVFPKELRYYRHYERSLERFRIAYYVLRPGKTS